MDAVGQYLFIFITVYSNLIELEAVTVSTFLCPTNKISPRQRQSSSSPSSRQDDGTSQDSWKIRSPRTLDLIYDLLGPSRPQRQFDLLSDPKEQSQEDDKDDCGERQGFGKKDLSSVTQIGRTKNLWREGRKYTVYNNPPYSSGPIIPPFISQRPLSPGPQNNLEGNIKPVWEYILEPPLPDFRPDLIGGPLAYIVGFSSRRPSTEDPPTEGPLTEEPTTKALPPKEPSVPIQFPGINSSNTTRLKKSQQGKSTSIFRSFVDLLFN